LQTKESIEKFRDIAKISDIDLLQIDAEISHILEEEVIKENIQRQVEDLEEAIFDAERKGK